MRNFFLASLSLLLFSCATTEENTYDITSKDVDTAIASHREELMVCVNTELDKDPKVAGDFILSWTITPAGKVEDEVILSNDAPVKDIADCVLRLMRKWQFPKLGGDKNAHVEYPFHVKPKE